MLCCCCCCCCCWPNASYEDTQNSGSHWLMCQGSNWKSAKQTSHSKDKIFLSSFAHCTGQSVCCSPLFIPILFLFVHQQSMAPKTHGALLEHGGSRDYTHNILMIKVVFNTLNSQWTDYTAAKLCGKNFSFSNHGTCMRDRKFILLYLYHSGSNEIISNKMLIFLKISCSQC